MDSNIVKLVALPGAPGGPEHFFQAHLDNAADAAVFEPHWDRPVADQSLAGLTVEEALAKLNEKLLDAAYGHH